jgi:DNA-binding HxlR family transcriptional regulator
VPNAEGAVLDSNFPMGGDEGRESQCDETLTQVFSVLGKRWSGLILGTLLQRPARFGELARAIDGITESMLSARLGELQEAGLVEREVLEGGPRSRPSTG